MAYRVEIKQSAQKEIAALPRRDQRRVVAAIEGLAEEPRPSGVRKLSGEDDRYRIRVGEYRVVYEIADKQLIVWVIRVRHRKDVYR